MPVGQEVNFYMMSGLEMWDWAWKGESVGKDVTMGGSEQPDDKLRAL